MYQRHINLIVVHCSATSSGQPLQQGLLNAPQVINAWHAARGFKRQAQARQSYNPDLPSIGYHFVVDLNGDIWTGRSLVEAGAHVAGHNANSVGICMVGGKERQGQYTTAQWRNLAELVRMLSVRCRVPLVYSTTEGVCGHRDLSPDTDGSGRAEPREWLKTCPGFDVSDWVHRGLIPHPQHTLPEGA